MKKIAIYEITCPQCGTVQHEIINMDDPDKDKVVCDAFITVEIKREDGSTVSVEEKECGWSVKNIAEVPSEMTKKLSIYDTNDLLFFWAKRSVIGSLKKQEKVEIKEEE